jgi:hypothetical protein
VNTIMSSRVALDNGKLLNRYTIGGFPIPMQLVVTAKLLQLDSTFITSCTEISFTYFLRKFLLPVSNALGRNSSGSGLESREYGRGDPLQ